MKSNPETQKSAVQSVNHAVVTKSPIPGSSGKTPERPFVGRLVPSSVVPSEEAAEDGEIDG